MTKQIVFTGQTPKLLTHDKGVTTMATENKARVLTFKEHMSNLNAEELAHNIATWKADQKKLEQKLIKKNSEGFNRPFAKQLAMVRANRKS